jgi:ferritin-like metal-binding protein YciE
MAKASKSTAGRKGGQAKAASKSAARSSSGRGSNSSSAGRSSTGRGKKESFDEETLLNELFVEELKDIYWAEKHLTKALPKLMRACTSPELASAFENHTAQTEEQVSRVEQVFEMLDMTARAKKCEAMEGLVKEAQQAIEDTPKGSSVRDAALIICGQKVEHYEIAAYGSLVQLAKTIGRTDIADVLAETLAEEKETDELLTELAESGINITASQESE